MDEQRGHSNAAAAATAKSALHAVHGGGGGSSCSLSTNSQLDEILRLLRAGGGGGCGAGVSSPSPPPSTPVPVPNPSARQRGRTTRRAARQRFASSRCTVLPFLIITSSLSSFFSFPATPTRSFLPRSPSYCSMCSGVPVPSLCGIFAHGSG